MQPAALVIVMIAVILALGVFLLKRKKKQDSHVSQVIPTYVAVMTQRNLLTSSS